MPSPTRRMKTDPDEQLIRRINAGDESAFCLLVDGHGQRLYGIAYNMTRTAADAEDLVQETFIAAFEGFAGFGRRASVKTWLTRILFKRVARHYRRQAVRKTVSLDSGAEHYVETGSVERTQLQMDIRKALAGLDERFRQVIVLREMESYTYQEIAEILRVPRGTVESRLHRARKKLQILLADYQVGEMPEQQRSKII